MRKRKILTLLWLALAVFGCTTPPAVESTATTVPPTEVSRTITITGVLTTIWNDQPQYTLTDDQGQRTKLLLEDETARPLGGPLELDRKRVTIVGEIVGDSPRTVRVQTVQFANP